MRDSGGLRAWFHFVGSCSSSMFLFEHDLRANASRLSRGKTGSHFPDHALVDCRHALRGLVECLDFGQILCVCIAKICPCLGVDSRGSHGKDRLGDVVRAKSASQNSGGLNSFDDTSTNVPIMGDTKRANLRIALAMAVE